MTRTRLVFATNNKYKLKEIKEIVGNRVELLSLADIGCHTEIPEDHNTLEANASQKAFFIYNRYHINCFADDTGLEIKALGNRPGVYSARYSENTEEVSKDIRSEANIRKVLREMKGITERKAQFKTVISLVEEGIEKRFEGVVKGEILLTKKGYMGFGYDPIFMPDGYEISFAEMKPEEKNGISHRAKAIQKLIDYLNIKY
jgi:XTP/dITP diphosphohydrolase